MTRKVAGAAFVIAILAGCSEEAPPRILDVQVPEQKLPKEKYPPSNGLIQIFFDFDSDELTTVPHKIVDSAASIWKLCPKSQITIAGHTDHAEDGPRAIDLSRRRAMNVRDALIARGGDPAMISIEAHGSSRPETDVWPGPREPFNRRTDIAIPCLDPAFKR